MEARATNYRLLFYVALLSTTACFVFAMLAVRRTQEARQRASVAESMIGKIQFFDPTNLAASRDQNYSFTIDNYGFRYQGTSGNLVEDTLLLAGAWEKYMLFFMRDYGKRASVGDTAFLDIGAEAGSVSFFMAKHMKQVHAFEPAPETIQRFKANQALNKFDNVTLHEVGIGDREALLPFTTNTFRVEWAQGPQLTLKIVTGDTWLEKHPSGPIGIIKMDIEGYEEPALKGLRQTLEKNRPLLVVEISHPPLGTITSFEQLRSLFPANYGFLYFLKTRQGYFDGSYELADFEPHAGKFFKDGDHHKGDQVDIVAYPLEKDALVPRKSSAAAASAVP